MYLLHVTKTKNARLILKQKKIKAGKVNSDIYQLIEKYHERYLDALDAGYDILKVFSNNPMRFTNEIRYPYLGKAVYCFSPSDYTHAERYGKSVLDTESYSILKLHLQEGHSMYDLTDDENLSEFSRLLEKEVVKYFKYETEYKRDVLQFFIELIRLNISYAQLDDQEFVPFTIGMGVDLLDAAGLGYDIVSYRFPKREAKYFGIKNTNIIQKIDY